MNHQRSVYYKMNRKTRIALLSTRLRMIHLPISLFFKRIRQLCHLIGINATRQAMCDKIDLKL